MPMTDDMSPKVRAEAASDLRAEWERLKRETAQHRVRSDAVIANLNRAIERRERQRDRMAMAGYMECSRCGRFARTGVPFFGVHFCG